MSKKTKIENEISDEEFERIMSIDPPSKPRRSRKAKRLPATDSNGVGYKNPPKSGQFKKGQSGNPKGRPKKATGNSGMIDLESALTHLAKQKVKIEQDGEIVEVNYFDAFIMKMVHKSLYGSTRDQIAILKAFKEHAPHLVKTSEETEDKKLPEGIRIKVVRAKDVKTSDGGEETIWEEAPFYGKFSDGSHAENHDERRPLSAEEQAELKAESDDIVKK